MGLWKATPSRGNIPSPSLLGPQPRSSQTGHPCLEIKLKELLLLQEDSVLFPRGLSRSCGQPLGSQVGSLGFRGFLVCLDCPSPTKRAAHKRFNCPSLLLQGNNCLQGFTSTTDASGEFCHRNSRKDEIENQREVKPEGEATESPDTSSGAGEIPASRN